MLFLVQRDYKTLIIQKETSPGNLHEAGRKMIAHVSVMFRCKRRTLLRRNFVYFRNAHLKCSFVGSFSTLSNMFSVASSSFLLSLITLHHLFTDTLKVLLRKKITNFLTLKLSVLL